MGGSRKGRLRQKPQHPVKSNQEGWTEERVGGKCRKGGLRQKLQLLVKSNQKGWTEEGSTMSKSGKVQLERWDGGRRQKEMLTLGKANPKRLEGGNLGGGREKRWDY